MSWSEISLAVGAVVALGVWWAWLAASRLDRLHRKVEASRHALESQLVRRASAAAELAASGLLDPASAVLVGEAASGALHTDEAPPEDWMALGDGERGLAESELSRTLRAALADPAEVAALRADPAGEELLAALAAAWYRVQLARRFHNEAVAQAQRRRRLWWVRLLRMAGHAAMPQTVELDDAWPDGLIGVPAGPMPG